MPADNTLETNMKLLSRLRDHPGAEAAAADAQRNPAQVTYSRDEFLDPSDPAEFEPVVSPEPAPVAELLP
jgi:hypothetical protein